MGTIFSVTSGGPEAFWSFRFLLLLSPFLTESPSDQIRSTFVFFYLKLSPLERDKLAFTAGLAGSLVVVIVDKKMLLRMLNSEPATGKNQMNI